MTAGGHIRGRSGCCLLFLAVFVAFWFLSILSSAHGHSGGAGSGGCPFSSSSSGHDHHRDHHHHEANHDLHYHGQSEVKLRRKLPEELAEEEDLELERLLDDHHDHHHHHGHGGPGHITSKLALWTSAMGCSLLVSLASLICLIFLPVLFLKGKPSKIVVDSLATFGAGAMLGDAFLHQLPHAFGGEHSHSHDHGSHSHSLKDLSVGLSVLSGIILFLLVEKLVRYVENISGKGADVRGHGHHHHSHMRQNKLKDDDICDGDLSSESSDSGVRDTQEAEGKGNGLDGVQQCLKDESRTEHDTSLRQRLHRNIDDVNTADLKESDSVSGVLVKEKESSSERSSSSHSSLVFGYLNLFSDGVHNFTDGMALGSAFLLYGSVGGWSRTLFLLAHELPQEIGDFGILIHSGFTVSKALVFNFLSALVALAGTALALLLGKDPGHSSLIEGFTAGGFIYIAVAGVLPEMNSGSTTLKSTAAQLTSLILGMAVALCISLVE